jgi:hypothetical protein
MHFLTSRVLFGFACLGLLNDALCRNMQSRQQYVLVLTGFKKVLSHHAQLALRVETANLLST